METVSASDIKTPALADQGQGRIEWALQEMPVLSRLCGKIYTVEVVPELSDAAKRLFQTLGYDNIEACTGNGYDGWPEHAPYDGIIVTAAATYIPTALVEQLKPGGMVHYTGAIHCP